MQLGSRDSGATGRVGWAQCARVRQLSNCRVRPATTVRQRARLCLRTRIFRILDTNALPANVSSIVTLSSPSPSLFETFSTLPELLPDAPSYYSRPLQPSGIFNPLGCNGNRTTRCWKSSQNPSHLLRLQRCSMRATRLPIAENPQKIALAFEALHCFQNLHTECKHTQLSEKRSCVAAPTLCVAACEGTAPRESRVVLVFSIILSDTTSSV